MNDFSLHSLSYSCPCRSPSAILLPTHVTLCYPSIFILASLAFHYPEKLSSSCKFGNFTIYSFFQVIYKYAKCGPWADYLQAILFIQSREIPLYSFIVSFFFKHQDQRIPPFQKITTLTFSSVSASLKTTTFSYSLLFLFSITLPKLLLDINSSPKIPTAFLSVGN